MSPESTSSLFPDRPIRPLPKRRLRERLSPDVAESIKYPPVPQANTPLFVYPYNPRDDVPSASPDPVSAIGQVNGIKPGAESGFRRNVLTTAGRDDDSLMSQARRALGSRGFQEPAEHGFRVPRSIQSRQPKPQPPPSTASSADGYDSFENTNNKKKRKIPIAGEIILNGTHVLNEPAAFGIPSPPGNGDDEGGDHVPISTPYYQSGGPLGNGQGISGPGRGRYGRVRNGRSPLRSLSDSSGNWTGRNMKLRTATQYPSPPAENSGIISTAIASAEKHPVLTGQENVSLLQQQAHAKTTSRSSPQFTFTFGSQSSVSWPGSDPSSHIMSSPHRAQQSANSAEYHGVTGRGTQVAPGLSPNVPGPGSSQTSAHPASDSPAKGASNATSPEKPKRRGYSLLQAAKQRRRETQYQNTQHPPAPEDYYLCEFCEYELIFGEPPEALIRQYEIKDRRRRRDEAERRRLLEKAKMKSRKSKKPVGNGTGAGNIGGNNTGSNTSNNTGNTTGKMPANAKSNTVSDRASVTASDLQQQPGNVHRHGHDVGGEERGEEFESEDNYDGHPSYEEEKTTSTPHGAHSQLAPPTSAECQGGRGGPKKVS